MGSNICTPLAMKKKEEEEMKLGSRKSLKETESLKEIGRGDMFSIHCTYVGNYQ